MKKTLIALTFATLMVLTSLGALAATVPTGSPSALPSIAPSSVPTTAYANGTFSGAVNDNTYTSGSTTLKAAENSSALANLALTSQSFTMSNNVATYSHSNMANGLYYYGNSQITIGIQFLTGYVYWNEPPSAPADFSGYDTISMTLTINGHSQTSTINDGLSKGAESTSNYYYQLGFGFNFNIASEVITSSSVSVSVSNYYIQNYGSYTSWVVDPSNLQTIGASSGTNTFTTSTWSGGISSVDVYGFTYSGVTASTGTISYPSAVLASQFSYSSPYPLEASASGQTTSQGTSATLTFSSAPPSSVTFQDVSGDPDVSSFTVSWNTPNVLAAISQAASFSSQYTVSENGNWFNGTPSFTISPPSGWINGATVDGAAWNTQFTYSLANLYVAGYGAPYDQFSVTGHKAASAYQPSSQYVSAFTSPQDSIQANSATPVSYTTHDLVNYLPAFGSSSTSLLEANPHQQVTWTIHTTEQISQGESIQIDWQDNTPAYSSPVHAASSSFTYVVSHAYNTTGSYTPTVVITNYPNAASGSETSAVHALQSVTVDPVSMSASPADYTQVSTNAILSLTYGAIDTVSQVSLYINSQLSNRWNPGNVSGTLSYDYSSPSLQPILVQWDLYTSSGYGQQITMQYGSDIVPTFNSSAITVLQSNTSTDKFPISLSGAPTDYSYPISITTNAPNASLSYQQQITISNPSNYHINSAGSNIKFEYQNGTQIYAWEQSVNSSQIVVWLNLSQNVNTTILMDVYSQSDNFFSASGHLGEAPSISPGHDNLRNVLHNYSFINQIPSVFNVFEYPSGYSNTSSGLYLNGANPGGGSDSILFSTSIDYGYNYPFILPIKPISLTTTWAGLEFGTYSGGGILYYQQAKSGSPLPNLTLYSNAHELFSSQVLNTTDYQIEGYGSGSMVANSYAYSNGNLIASVQSSSNYFTSSSATLSIADGQGQVYLPYIMLVTPLTTMPTTSIGSPTTFAYSGDHYYQEINVTTAGKGINSYGNNVMIGSSSGLYNTTVIHSGSTTQLQAYLPFSSTGTLNEFLYVFPAFENLSASSVSEPYSTQASYKIGNATTFQANATTSSSFQGSPAGQYNGTWIYMNYNIPISPSTSFVTAYFNASWEVYNIYPATYLPVSGNFVTWTNVTGFSSVQLTLIQPSRQINNPEPVNIALTQSGTNTSIPSSDYSYFSVQVTYLPFGSSIPVSYDPGSTSFELPYGAAATVQVLDYWNQGVGSASFSVPGSPVQLTIPLNMTALSFKEQDTGALFSFVGLRSGTINQTFQNPVYVKNGSSYQWFITAMNPQTYQQQLYSDTVTASGPSQAVEVNVSAPLSSLVVNVNGYSQSGVGEIQNGGPATGTPSAQLFINGVSSEFSSTFEGVMGATYTIKVKDVLGHTLLLDYVTLVNPAETLTLNITTPSYIIGFINDENVPSNSPQATQYSNISVLDSGGPYYTFTTHVQQESMIYLAAGYEYHLSTHDNLTNQVNIWLLNESVYYSFNGQNITQITEQAINNTNHGLLLIPVSQPLSITTGQPAVFMFEASLLNGTLLNESQLSSAVYLYEVRNSTGVPEASLISISFQPGQFTINVTGLEAGTYTLSLRVQYGKNSGYFGSPTPFTVNSPGNVSAGLSWVWSPPVTQVEANVSTPFVLQVFLTVDNSTTSLTGSQTRALMANVTASLELNGNFVGQFISPYYITPGQMGFRVNVSTLSTGYSLQVSIGDTNLSGHVVHAHISEGFTSLPYNPANPPKPVTGPDIQAFFESPAMLVFYFLATLAGLIPLMIKWVRKKDRQQEADINQGAIVVQGNIATKILAGTPLMTAEQEWWGAIPQKTRNKLMKEGTAGQQKTFRLPFFRKATK